MSISVTCMCGQSLNVPEESAGDRIRCTVCGSSVRVPTISFETAPFPDAGMIRFNCPCGQPCQAESEYAGRKTKCPRCAAILSIPFADRSIPRVHEAPRTDRSSLTERPSTQPPTVSRRPDRDDDEPYRVRRRSVKKRPASKAWILVLAGVALLALGGVILWLVLSNKINEDFDLVPRDAQMFVTVRVSDALEAELGRKLLDAIPDKTGLRDAEKKLGMQLQDIERLTVVFVDLERMMGWGIVHTKKDYDEDKIRAAMDGPQEKTHKGKTYYFRPGQWPAQPLAVHFVGPRVLVVGPEEGVKQCLDLPDKPKDDGPLADALKLASRNKSHAGMGMNLSDPKLRQMFLNKMMGRGGFNNPFENVKTMAFGIHLSSSITLTMLMEFNDRGLAKQVESQIDEGIKQAKRMDAGMLPQEAALILRVLAKTKCSRSGSTVEMVMEFDEQTINAIVDLFKKQMGQNFAGFGQ